MLVEYAHQNFIHRQLCELIVSFKFEKLIINKQKIYIYIEL